MRPTLARSSALLAPLAALALVLGGCSGDTDEPTATADTDESTADATEPAEEEPAEDDSAAAGGGAACVEGSWVTDTDALVESTTSALGMAEAGAVVTITGESVTTFSGGSVTQEYADQVTEVSVSLEGQEMRMVTRFDGTLTGTATVTDDEVTIADVDESALTVEYTTFLGGQEIEMPDLEETATAGFELGGTSSYTCSGDELRLTPIVEGTDTSGFVTLLHRQ